MLVFPAPEFYNKIKTTAERSFAMNETAEMTALLEKMEQTALAQQQAARRQTLLMTVAAIACVGVNCFLPPKGISTLPAPMVASKRSTSPLWEANFKSEAISFKLALQG